MEKLVKEFEASKLHPIEKAALFHLKFEGVHPFVDGNGRTGRLILNLFLMQNGYPPVNVKFADRKRYYDVFDSFYRNSDASAMVKMVAEYVEERLSAYNELAGGGSMRVLLTSAGLETEEIEACFVDMAGKDMSSVKALLIPTAAIDADAIEVLPKCMHDLLKCGIPSRNIDVWDLHAGMAFEKLQSYDVVYLCGGNTNYLLERIHATGFHQSLTAYIHHNGLVIGVSAGSLLFSNHLAGHLELIDTKLDVHCATGEKRGKLAYPLQRNIRLTHTCALVIRGFPDGVEIIGE